jgi:signal recognition particle GTPase
MKITVPLIYIGFTVFAAHSFAMTNPQTAQRHPTIRKLSTLSDDGHDNQSTTDRVLQMVERAKEGTVMTDEEISIICNGISNLVPSDAPIDFEELKMILKDAAHLSHKNWDVTSKNSDILGRSLSISSDAEDPVKSVLSDHAHQLLERILSEGNWRGAAKHSSVGKGQAEKPWAVLVTGVNGIRKTTSMYQPWFKEALAEALCPPNGEKVEGSLPTGGK